MPFTSLSAYLNKTANYTLLANDDVAQFNCAAGSLTGTLPDATLVTLGKRFEIRRANDAQPANVLTVNTTAAQTIDGRASGSIKLQPYDYLIVVSDGSNWQVVSIRETVSAYVKNGAATITASDSIVKHSVIVHDTHGGYSSGTGLYTVSAPGYYIVSINVDVAAGAFTETQFATASINKNGAFYNGNVAKGATGNSDLQATASIVMLCAAGDTISQNVASNASGPSIGSAAYTWLSIIKM